MEGLSDKFLIEFFQGKTGSREQFMREVIGKMIAPYPGVTYEQIMEILPVDVKRELEETVDSLKDALIGANNMVMFEPTRSNFDSISHEFTSYEDRRVYRCLGIAYKIIDENEDMFACLIEDDD